MKTADVNWLLAACVQSGAALVAIVGGILGARFVSLDAERQAAQRRFEEVEARVNTARAASAEADDALEQLLCKDLLDCDAVYEAVARSQPDGPSLDSVLEPAQLRELPIAKEPLEARVALINTEMNKAVSTLTETMPAQSDDRWPMWEEYRRTFRLDPRHDGVWEWIYNELADKLEEEAAERRRERGGIAGLLGSRISPRRISGPPAPDPIPAARQHAAAARAESLTLSTELSVAREHVELSTPPSGFGLAIQTLMSVALTTIALPLALLIAGPMALPLWLRLVVGLLFAAGVIILLRYLQVYARVLTRGTPRDRLPDHVWQLVRRK